MVLSINRKRLLVEVEVIPVSKIILAPGTKRANNKFVKGKVIKVGSDVTVAAPGDSVTLFNEGIVWEENGKKFRIVNEPAIIVEANETT